MSGGGAERRGARTHELQDHDLRRTWMLSRQSHSGAPKLCPVFTEFVGGSRTYRMLQQEGPEGSMADRGLEQRSQRTHGICGQRLMVVTAVTA